MQNDPNENCYQKLEKCGEGTTGTVYKCKNVKTNELVAIKMIRRESTDENDNQSEAELNEVRILKRLKGSHKNIVELQAVINEERRYKLIFEWCDMDLASYLRHNQTSLPLLLSWFRQILDGVSYIHSHNIVHFDLNPSNLLLSLSSNTIKIC